MSTRSVFTFKDNSVPRDEFHVYKHNDGYPDGALEAILNMIPYSFDLPRFEASDAAAAFISGNKEGGGNIYLTHSFKNHYTITKDYRIA